MKKKGFSLIELLVVIAIIGILSTVVLVSLGPARVKSRDSRRTGDLRQINVAMEMCYSDTACWQETYPQISAITPNAILAIPPYLDALPADPTNIAPYVYTWTANNAPTARTAARKYYCVYVKLESSANTYFCASSKGVNTKTAPFSACSNTNLPCNDDCCDNAL